MVSRRWIGTAWAAWSALPFTSLRTQSTLINAAIPEVEEMNLQTRKVSLGVMGFCRHAGSAWPAIRLRRGCRDGPQADAFIMEQSDDRSAALAKVRGRAYRRSSGSEEEKSGERPMQSACRLTVAPTGDLDDRRCFVPTSGRCSRWRFISTHSWRADALLRR